MRKSNEPTVKSCIHVFKFIVRLTREQNNNNNKGDILLSV